MAAPIPLGRTSSQAQKEDAPLLRPHTTFWFEDGSMLITHRKSKTIFKLHGSLLARHSPVFAKKHKELIRKQESSHSNPKAMICNVQLGEKEEADVTLEDWIALLEHLYHDRPLQIESKFTRIASVLRVTSPDVLDFPEVHDLALERLNMILPSSSKEVKDIQHRDAVLRKFVHYDAVTSPDPTPEETTEASSEQLPNGASTPPPPADATPATPSNGTDAELVAALMTRFIEHFSPTIFTPPPTSHMECTDTLASIWLECVIRPALQTDGVYKPLETLEAMKEVDWEGKGLCEGCSKEKRDEWTEEQKVVWRLLDEWLVDGAK